MLMRFSEALKPEQQPTNIIKQYSNRVGSYCPSTKHTGIKTAPTGAPFSSSGLEVT